MTSRRGVFQFLLAGLIAGTCSLAVSGSPNAMYDAGDVHSVLMAAAKNRVCVESGARARRGEPGAPPRTPSARHVQSVLRRTDAAAFCRDFEAHVAKAYRRLVELGAARGGLTVAIDVNDKPRYDKKVSKGMVITRSKNSTSKMERHMTMQCVDRGARLHLAAVPMSRGDTLSETVPKVVEKALNAGVKIRLILMDREFFTAEVVSYLTSMNIRFLMPCPNRHNVVGALREYGAGMRGRTSRCVIEGVRARCGYTIIVAKRRVRADGRDPDGPGSRYIAFATSVSLEEAQGRARQMVESYRSRWGIESGYRVNNKSRLTTTSRDPGVRHVCFLYSLMVYNMWTLYKAAASGRSWGAVGMALFRGMLYGALLLLLRGETGGWPGGSAPYTRRHRPPPRAGK